MAYSTPRTWVSGEYPTAAQFNANVRDNFNGAFPLGPPDAAWTAYTPTLTQSAVVTKTVSYARYTKTGRTVTAAGVLVVTGAGTAANVVLVGLPVAAAAGLGFLTMGIGNIYDSSAGLMYKGIVDLGGSTTSFRFMSTNATTNAPLGADTFTAALAVGDEIKFTVVYEAAA